MEENETQETGLAMFSEEATSKALATYKLTDERLEEMQGKADKLTIKDINDSVGYRKVKKGAAAAKKYRTGVERIRKNLKAGSLDFGRKIDEEAKRLTEKIKKIETELVGRKNAHETKIAAKRAEVFEQRRLDLTEAGYVFDGKYYTLGQLFLSPDAIESSTNEDFAEHIRRAKTEKERVDEAFRLDRDKNRDTESEQSEAATVSEDVKKEVIKQEPTTAQTHRPEVEVVASNNEQAPVEKSVKSEFVSTKSIDSYMEGYDQMRRQVIFLMDRKELKTRGEMIAAINNLRPPA